MPEYRSRTSTHGRNMAGARALWRATGMTVSLSPMSGTPGMGDHRQRRVDVDLASHLVWQASLPQIQRIVVTTGDQDFQHESR